MSITKIEWVRNPDGSQGYTINPVKGLCPMACSYCYARRMYKRFKWDTEIRYDPMIVTEPLTYPNPSKIFVGSTMELFGDWIKLTWLENIFEFCQRETNKRHTFIFLTKQPQNLIKWSPFPDNCWIGVSLTGLNWNRDTDALFALKDIKAKVKYISYEPLLGQIGDVNYDYFGINWLIIGQQTPASAKTQPKIEWIQEIVEAADKAKIPVFLKDNLNPIFATNDCEYFTKYRDTLFVFKDFLDNGRTSWHLRQEFPI